jgi:hypothetical protein
MPSGLGKGTGRALQGECLGQPFSLGKISGIRIGVNWSVLVIVALLAYGPGSSLRKLRGIRRLAGW